MSIKLTLKPGRCGGSCIVSITFLQSGKRFKVNLLVFRLNWAISLFVRMTAVRITAT